MIEIDNTLVSRDLVEEQFVCDLSACKGACCVEGDLGAPLEEKELSRIEENLEGIRPFMSSFGIEVLDEAGFSEQDDDEWVTTTYQGRECVFSKYDKEGILKCAIEEAHKAGKSDFLKPVSCHLYPVRVSQHNVGLGVNYDRWKICAPACSLGKELKVPVYKFLKNSLIRKFGQEWYNQLSAVADYLKKEKE